MLLLSIDTVIMCIIIITTTKLIVFVIVICVGFFLYLQYSINGIFICNYTSNQQVSDADRVDVVYGPNVVQKLKLIY